MSSRSSIPPSQTRRGTEIELLRPFIETVVESGRYVVDQSQLKRRQAQQAVEKGVAFTPQKDLLKHPLTEAEQVVFRKSAYFGWGQGFCVGAATFGILWGAMRFRRLGKVVTLPSRQSVQAASALLEPQAASSKRALTQDAAIMSSTHKPSMTTMIAQDVGFLLSGALALVITVVTASVFFDHTAFYRELASVPLKPGKSHLCQRMCPLLVERQRSVQNNRLWMDPETEELEAVIRLVKNCQLRMDYEAQLRKQQGIESQETIEIPEPGVPLQYDYAYDKLEASES